MNLFACEPAAGYTTGWVPSYDLELLVAPVGVLGAFVGGVPNRDRILGERFAGIRGLEDELDHLPVALVEVVEVVEDVEEPVLKRNFPRVAGIRGDMGVDGGRASLPQPAVPPLVGTAWVERVPREVEVIPVQADEILRTRSDLDEICWIPGAAKRHSRLTE